MVTGKGYRPKLVRLSRAQTIGAWAFIATIIALSIVLPLLALIWTSLNIYFVLPSWQAFQNVTLNGYRSISLMAADVPIKNSIILVLTVASCIGTYALARAVPVLRLPLGLKPLEQRRTPEPAPSAAA